MFKTKVKVSPTYAHLKNEPNRTNAQHRLPWEALSSLCYLLYWSADHLAPSGDTPRAFCLVGHSTNAMAPFRRSLRTAYAVWHKQSSFSFFKIYETLLLATHICNVSSLIKDVAQRWHYINIFYPNILLYNPVSLSLHELMTLQWNGIAVSASSNQQILSVLARVFFTFFWTHWFSISSAFEIAFADFFQPASTKWRSFCWGWVILSMLV